jgi:hypothetical protein
MRPCPCARLAVGLADDLTPVVAVNRDSTRVPNLLVAGVSRAGTTSMFHYLAQHPDVIASDVKELRYFTPLRYGEPLAPVESYAAHFPHDARQQYALEATPGYFYGGRALARGISAICPPDTHVVVSLRSPLERCWSWFGFVKSRLRIPKDMTFETYVDRCEQLHLAGIDDRVEHQPFWGLGGGCYSRWLDDWVDEFGDRFRVVFFDDLTEAPHRVITELCAWLGLDREPVDRFDFSVDNKTQQYRHQALQKVAIGLNRQAESLFHSHRHVKRVLRRGYFMVNKAPAQPGMTPAMRARLADFYRPHNKRLSEQLAELGLELPVSWSSDGHRQAAG